MVYNIDLLWNTKFKKKGSKVSQYNLFFKIKNNLYEKLCGKTIKIVKRMTN